MILFVLSWLRKYGQFILFSKKIMSIPSQYTLNLKRMSSVSISGSSYASSRYVGSRGSRGSQGLIIIYFFGRLEHNLGESYLTLKPRL